VSYEANLISLPLNVPNQPAFGREVFQHEIKTLAEGIAYDDLYHMNTQSGTQWDGFRSASNSTQQLEARLTTYQALCTHQLRVVLQWCKYNSMNTRLLLIVL
jgi:hypothetical protein